VIAGGFHTDLEPTPVRLSPDFTSFSLKEPEFKGAGDLYLVAYPSYKFYDGRGANKPWLQELPDALTTVVWDSWVEINPETARALGVGEGDFVSVESTVGKVEAQVFVYDGIRRDTVAIAVGQGHTSYGRYAKGAGVNPIELLPASLDASSGGFAWLSARVKVTATGKRGKLVKTQNTMDQAGRAIAVATTMGSLVAGSHSGEGEGGHNGHADFYPKHTYLQHRWGMTIDLDKCTGCGACVVACYAENNIPVVGKLQVAKRREMSWIRIERYFERDENGNMDVRFIPMTCQHCENAPCEPVCPVYATYTNPEGLNAMVYSRCVGTRYCSNNCTYKVRRFNWFNYQWPEPLNWQLNPDVTVRGVGVMEKCTFCVQRIHAAKEVAKNEGRTLRDGEVKTACQQTCPSQAIVFGDINSQDTEVSKMFADARGYRVLEEINTQPAITYLKKVKWDVA
jgi:molybdopterin-containing oxidoreductase family iron-sulfur binding subunit